MLLAANDVSSVAATCRLLVKVCEWDAYGITRCLGERVRALDGCAYFLPSCFFFSALLTTTILTLLIYSLTSISVENIIDHRHLDLHNSSHSQDTPHPSRSCLVSSRWSRATSISVSRQSPLPSLPPSTPTTILSSFFSSFAH